MTKVWGWMAGKKTYLLAGVLLAAGFGLLLTGRMTPSAAMAIGLLATCGFPATFRSALGRHKAEEMAILVSIAETGAALSMHNFGVARVEAVQAATAAAALYPELKAECEQAPNEGSSFTGTGDPAGGAK